MPYWTGSTYDRQSRRAIEAGPTGSDLDNYLVSRQLVEATSDVSDGHWTTQSGAATNLFAVVDETPFPIDTDYAQSYFSSVPDSFVLAVDPTLLGPVAGNQYLRYRYGKDAVGGHRVDLTVALLQSGVSIQTWVHQDIPAGFVQVAQLVTVSITSYGALSARFTYQQV